MKHPFKLKNAALLMALASVYPMVAHSAAGVAQFTVGDVSVRRGNAASALTKGQPIESGDNITTGGGGQAQIRFTDGGLVSLAPNSQFNIANYADNDAGRDNFAVNLFRGGMRAITGLIGKRSRDNYKVTTNTATIGIRGSAFSANYDSDGSLTVAGEQDAIQVCTNAGCVDLTVGEIARVTSSDRLPNRTSLRTNLPPLAGLGQAGSLKNQPEFEFDSNRPVPDPGQIPPVPVPVPDDGGQIVVDQSTGVSAMFVTSGAGTQLYPGDFYGGQDPSTGTATLVGGELRKHVSPPPSGAHADLIVIEKTGEVAGSAFGTLGTANDPAFIGWGYWDTGKLSYAGASGIVTDGHSPEDLSNVHYIVGRPTPLVQMPQTGTAMFTLVGGTRPTAVHSTYNFYTGHSQHTKVVGDLVSAGLNVDFGSGYLSAVINTHFVKDGSAVDYQISDFGEIDGNTFRSSYTYGSNGYFDGFFTGDQATRAGLLYGGTDEFLGTVSGAAVFSRTGSGESVVFDDTIKGLYTSGDEYNVAGLPDAATTVFTTSPQAGTAVLVNNKLILQGDSSGGYCGTSFCVTSTSSVSNSGSLGTPANSDFIGWGYWARGTLASYSGSSDVLAGVHYLIGRPTSAMPTGGTATYTMSGASGSAPTATYGGTSILGTLVSARLDVNFDSQRLDARVATQFTKSGVTSNVNLQVNSVAINGARFSGNDGCGARVSGFFAGNLASRAGMVYRQDTFSNLGVVNGAVALQRGAIQIDDD